MRKLVVTENITLDGVIDATGGWFDPTDDSVDQSDLIEQTSASTREAADAFLCRAKHLRGDPRLLAEAGRRHRQASPTT